MEVECELSMAATIHRARSCWEGKWNEDKSLGVLYMWYVFSLRRAMHTTNSHVFDAKWMVNLFLRMHSHGWRRSPICSGPPLTAGPNNQRMSAI